MIGKKQFENETGTYFCDENGRLTAVQPREANCLYRPPFGTHVFDMCDTDGGWPGQMFRVRDLIIPKGVRSMGSEEPFSGPPAEDFQRVVVAGKLRFPSTLESLGSNVLSGSLIMDMVLPGTVRYIGSGAIMCCYIHRLFIGADLPAPEGGWHWKRARDDRWRKEAAGKLACGGRQFKETIIGTLIIPAGYPYKALMPEAKIDRLVTY